MVYELYDLNEEEIAIVENILKKNIWNAEHQNYLIVLTYDTKAIQDVAFGTY
tara:strand:+ start:5043 stop:5198 length:156 start_codon:yes stop_codon:yes gene_type:complete